MAEVFFRTIVIYIALLLIVRWLGKRMSGKLTITELGISIMLGAIVAPPMETPERGILQGILILLLVLLCHQGLTLTAIKRPKLEQVIHGRIGIFIKEGVLQLDEIRKTGVSIEQLFAALRERNIYNLGKIERMYMEAGGFYSIYQAKESRPGLSALPVTDNSVHTIQEKPDDQLKACTHCGNTIRMPAGGEHCKVCGNNDWDTAVR
jgi:uncharacterized membrane protein YcaP (DUF421 family)